MTQCARKRHAFLLLICLSCTTLREILNEEQSDWFYTLRNASATWQLFPFSKFTMSFWLCLYTTVTLSMHYPVDDLVAICRDIVSKCLNHPTVFSLQIVIYVALQNNISNDLANVKQLTPTITIQPTLTFACLKDKNIHIMTHVSFIRIELPI